MIVVFITKMTRFLALKTLKKSYKINYMNVLLTDFIIS